MDTLNQLETDILDRVASRYGSVKSHIPFLRVKDREKTGVGMYVNFIYIGLPPDLEDLEPQNSFLTGGGNYIEMDNLKYPLTFDVTTSNGKLEHIELVTNGNEAWDGTIGDYHFI